MPNKYMGPLILLSLITVEFFVDIVVKKWTLHQIGNGILLLVLPIFASSFLLWIWAMKVESFTRVVTFYSLISILGGAVLGYLVFGEKLSPLNLVGFALALAAILLLEL